MSIELPVYDYQPGDGPAVVMLHYWGGSARTWQLVTDLLPRHAALRMDFRGWSRSRSLPGPYSLQRYADDVLGVLADAGVGEYVVVGHSMGGKVAQLVAATRPAGLRGLVLVGPAPAVPSTTITAAHQDQLAHAYDTVESTAFVRDRVLTATPLSEAIGAQVIEDSRAGAPDARVQWPLHGIAEDISDQARRIEVPVLVVAGERDVVDPVDVLRQNLLPHLVSARLVEIAGAGHLMPLETPAALASLITGFIDDVSAATPPQVPCPWR